MSNRIIHLDCTLRDGGYYTDWDFSDELVKDYFEAAKSACINYVEIGFRFFINKGFKGAFAFISEEFLETLHIPTELKISVMINGTDLIDNGELIKGRLDKLVPVFSNQSKVDLFRIALDLEDFRTLLPVFQILNKKGYQTGANIMKVSEMNNTQLNAIGKLANKSNINVLYLADSFGSIEPKEIQNIVLCIRRHWKGEIGIHAHDNKGLALRNTLESIDHGITWVDSTITGMGRGAGNVRTEELVLELDRNQDNMSNLVPLLRIINNDFNQMKKKYSWGSNPYYYLAAKYAIHPSYIQRILSDYRFREEDILAVIDYLRKEGATKFISDQIESAKGFYYGKAIGTLSPKTIIQNRDVLILGSGEEAASHKNALEAYIRRKSPIVIAMNTKSQIDNKLINYRIACNPIRLMADIDMHLKLPQPLIAPSSMLPENIATRINRKQILDYGIGISKSGFEFHETYGMIPNPLVFAYALSFVASGQATNVYLAGFGGFGIGDPRNLEIDELIEKFKIAKPELKLISLTPTEYIGLNSISVYGM